MEVRQIMVTNPAKCCPDDALSNAVRIMGERSCGFVPIVESATHPRVVGVVTDRDLLMAAQMRGSRLEDLPLTAVASGPLKTCLEDDEIPTALATMLEVARLAQVDAFVHSFFNLRYGIAAEALGV